MQGMAGMAETKGLVMINTGRGKGKTTAALGQALRAAGQGLRVLIIQFIKGGSDYGELTGVGYLPGVEIRPTGLGLIKEGEDLEPHRRQARQGWDMARREVASGHWDMVILDEICVAMKRGFVELDEVIELIDHKPPALHLVLTGRYCPERLFGLADTVTVMDEVKHHMADGVEAQPGVEF